MLVGRRKAETWVHSFSVGGETRKYKGFTIYRITSIVFPRSIPEALTRITLWKRFSEVKKLYKELVRRHRERHLSGTVPALTEQSYFKRFDPGVIEERKRYILQLLEFAGQEPVLYRSHAFVSFFARGISPDDSDEGSIYGGSPVKENGSPGVGDRGNIETIRQTLGIRTRDEPSLIDPSRDGTTTGTSSTSGGEEEEDDQDRCKAAASVQDVNEPHASPMSASMVSSVISDTGSVLSEDKTPGATWSEDAMDYLVAAAMVFSKAVEAEANGEYQRAFEHYKAGIDRLLSGAKDDENVTRRKIAKEKSCKYVSKAEEIYDRYLAQAGPRSVDFGAISYDDPHSPIQLLERPLNYLSRYKVVKVIGTVMQVQDVTDKKFYIMKSIRCPPPAGGSWLSSAAVFPQDVPYMVPLVAYFQSTDGSIFLLLRLVCAGKLWDFIRSYRKQESYCPSPEELATCAVERENEENAFGLQPPVSIESEKAVLQGKSAVVKDPNTSGYDSGFLELVNEYSSIESNGSSMDADPSPDGERETDEIATEALDPDTATDGDDLCNGVQEVVIPSFDALSKDMDVRELLSCSQQLLKAVTQTLEESEPNSSKPKQSDRCQRDPPPADVSAQDDQECSNQAGRSHDLTTSIGSQETKSHSSQLGLVGVARIIDPNNGGGSDDRVSPDLLPEGSVRRWISELVIAVDSLHFNGIVCGDLTMDNLLLGPEGQLVLTYFHRRGESYFSQAGTNPIAPKQPAVRELYVAPERPLEPKSDFWSIGVIMFEMLTKWRFVSCHPSGVFSYHEVQYPEGVELSDDAKDLLEGLLQPDVERRFDFKQIIASPFFRTVDWTEVKLRGQLTPAK